MPPKNTDPNWTPASHEPHETTTEPSAAAARDAAADLLANLAKAPLPEEGVAETQGHDAASFAVGPHTPPPGRDDTLKEEPAVVLNTTNPFGTNPVTPEKPPLGTPPPAPAEIPLAEARKVEADPDADRTVPRPRRAQPSTVPSARAKSQRTSMTLIVGGILGIACAIGIVGFLMNGSPSSNEGVTSTVTTSAAPILAPPSNEIPPPAEPIAEPSADPTTFSSRVPPPPPALLPPSARRNDPPRRQPASASSSSSASTSPAPAAPSPRASSSSEFPWRQ